MFDVERGLLASGLSDKTVTVWSMAESRTVHRLRGNGHVSTCLRLTRPVLVVAGGQGWVHVWHVTRGQLLRSLDTCGAVIACLVVRGDNIVAGDVRGHVLAWDLDSDNTRDPRTSVTTIPPRILSTMTDAVRGLHQDNYNMISLSFDANCDTFEIL